MPVNPTTICNRALTEIARGKPFPPETDITTNFDGSATGIYCATIYPGAVALLLRSQDWTFNRRVASLTSTAGTPPIGWSQEYGYPEDCVRVRQVVPNVLDPFDPQPVRWDVGVSDVTGIISNSIVAFAGTSYAINDTGILTQALPIGSTTATYKVLTVSGGGAVLTYILTNPGSGYANTQVSPTAVGGGQPGAGTGLFIDIIAVTFASTRVIWTDQASARLVYSTSFVTAADFDDVFTEHLVRYLGSILAMPVAGRPDFSEKMLDISGRIGAAGLDKDS